MPYGKLGRRPTDPAALARMLTIKLTGVVPAHPLAADHEAEISEWNGDTNFNYGTCGPVTIANDVIVAWKYCLNEDITVSDSAIFALYRASGNPNFNPTTDADDNGVDMTVMLDALMRVGIDITHSDGTVENVKPLAYGKVDTAIDTVRAVTSIFGAAILAVDLKVAQQSQTDAGLWDYKSGSGEWGGHAIANAKYTSSAVAKTADGTVITWQNPCGFTDTFWSHQGQEVYVVVWPPMWTNPAFQEGVNTTALQADYSAVTNGKTIPVPDPGPTPTPTPTDPLAAWWAVMKPWCAGNRTRPDLVEVKAAALALAKAEGLK
jgi:hypothetical protein